MTSTRGPFRSLLSSLSYFTVEDAACNALGPAEIASGIAFYAGPPSVTSMLCCVAVQVVLAAGNEKFVAIGMKGGDLLVYSPTGRLMLPLLALGCSPAILQVAGELTLITVTVDGQLSVTNFAQVKGPGMHCGRVFLVPHFLNQPGPLSVKCTAQW